MNYEIIKKKNIEKNLNVKYLYIYMDEIITNSLNEGNMHFFITINFKEEIKKVEEIKKKITCFEKLINNIELLTWYNIITEKNKNENYHIHVIVAIKSLIGFNDCLLNNIKYYLINNFEIDTKINLCSDFINTKKAWRYLYKDYEKKEEKNEKEEEKDEQINKLDPKLKKNKIKKEKNNKKTIKKINILKIKKNEENWFKSIENMLNYEILNENSYDFLKGIKTGEKNYNERQLIFLWEFFLYINDMVIYNDKIYIKIENSMISYKEFANIDFLYENISNIFLYFKKEFYFQFNNFDELNFISKFLKNKNEKLTRFKEFTNRKINFNFNILEFKDGIYSILHNKFIRTNKFEKNYEINLKKLLKEKSVNTIKNYNYSYENLKEPTIWLNSVEKVLGLKKRSNNLKDKIVSFLKEDDIEWLLIYIAYIFHYSTNELNKKNTLYIWGPSNTGKTTLIINLFINYFGKDNIGLISNNKNFEYQHLINKNLLIFDEFDIEKINIENFKKLLSKELILGEKKGKEPELIKPTPILISSNYSLDYKLNMNENKEAISNRLKSINFKKKIKEEEMDNSINEKIREEEAKIIVYCNKIYFNKIKKGKKSRMNDIKLLEKL